MPITKPYTSAYRNDLRDVVQLNTNIAAHMFSHNNPSGSAEDIITPAKAAYYAGARTILTWGYYGLITNDYRANNPLAGKTKTDEAYRRMYAWKRR